MDWQGEHGTKMLKVRERENVIGQTPDEHVEETLRIECEGKDFFVIN